MGRLIVASNRTATPGEPKAGGLAVALWDALSERGGVWFGWSGDTVAQETRGIRVVREGEVEFALADLTEAEHEGYYLGYSNRALWPVFHYRVDLARFDEAEFECYAGVNRRFGRLLHQSLRPDDVVWVHDYHFLLLGQELRNNGWQGAIGFFLHIPFRPSRCSPPCPSTSGSPGAWRSSTSWDSRPAATWATSGATCATSTERPPGGRAHQGLRPHHPASGLPIGIDPEDFRRSAETEEAREAVRRVERFIGDRALVIGADRMDYSKGLPQRLQAFGRLLDDYEDLRGRVNLLQIVPPSREGVDAYRDLREELDRLAGRVTATTPTSTTRRSATSPAATRARSWRGSTGWRAWG
jgi:trehalose 6-phosphate synthase